MERERPPCACRQSARPRGSHAIRGWNRGRCGRYLRGRGRRGRGVAVPSLPRLGQAAGRFVQPGCAKRGDHRYRELLPRRARSAHCGDRRRHAGKVWISRQLGRPVFKAFNSILFHALSALGKPEGSPGRLAIPVAGDDARDKQIVMGLVNEIGFDPVDGGSLQESWRQQPSTPAYCCDYGAAKRGKGSGQRSRARRRRSATMRGGRDMAGSMPTSRPIPMPMPMSSQ